MWKDRHMDHNLMISVLVSFCALYDPIQDQHSAIGLAVGNYSPCIYAVSVASTTGWDLLKIRISWYVDFSWWRTSSTSKERLCPGHRELISENHPFLSSFMIRSRARGPQIGTCLWDWASVIFLLHVQRPEITVIWWCEWKRRGGGGGLGHRC